MNKIELRAWNKKEKVMEEPVSMFQLEYRSKDLVIMQSIGRSDKKGKEMFTGDIVKWHKHTAVVRYSKRWCRYILWNAAEEGHEEVALGDFGISPEECEIIGNKDKNPELLK